MRAYSTDLKERLVRAVAGGQPVREAARRFGVAVTMVKRAIVVGIEIGQIECDKRESRRLLKHASWA